MKLLRKPKHRFRECPNVDLRDCASGVFSETAVAKKTPNRQGVADWYFGNISFADFMLQTGAGRAIPLTNMHLAYASAVETCPVQTAYD